MCCFLAEISQICRKAAISSCLATKPQRYNALQRFDFPERILGVLRTQISACRACSPICAGYPQLVRVIQEKSREMLLSNDSTVRALKSLMKKTGKKLSTDSSFHPLLDR